MPLQESGNISLLDLKIEFGGNAIASLTDYYAGLGFVPSDAVNKDGIAIPSSGPISITDFYGAPIPIHLYDKIIDDTVTSPSTATAGIKINGDGSLDQTTTGSWTEIFGFGWHNDKPGSFGSLYEVKATYTGDAPTSGDITGSFLVLTSDRSWTLSLGQTGSDSCNLTLQIVKTGTTTPILASATFTLNVTVNPIE